MNLSYCPVPTLQGYERIEPGTIPSSPAVVVAPSAPRSIVPILRNGICLRIRSKNNLENFDMRSSSRIPFFQELSEEVLWIASLRSCSDGFPHSAKRRIRDAVRVWRALCVIQPRMKWHFLRHSNFSGISRVGMPLQLSTLESPKRILYWKEQQEKVNTSSFNGAWTRLTTTTAQLTGHGSSNREREEKIPLM